MANKKEEITTQNIDINQIKVELVDYVKNQVNAEVDNQIREKEKKYIKSKSRKIFFLELLIFLLIAIIIGSFIFLYNDHYFDKYRKNYTPEECEKVASKNCESKKEEKKEETKEEEQKPTLEELIKKYDGIFDNIRLTNKNNYLVDFYGEKYNDELKLSMVTDLIDLKDVIDDDSVIIESDKLTDLSRKLFANGLNLVTYKYNDVELHYYKKLDKFVAATNIEEGIPIKRDIIGIEEKDNVVLITTEEYYEVDDKQISPLTNAEGKEKKTYEFILKNEKYILNV